jgi:hypothetical protein
VARATGGGRATQTGTDYQNRSAAWFAVFILAERDVALPLGLPAQTTLESIWCETTQPVDDLNVRASQGGVIFGQAKHTLNLETGEESDLASTLDQFVRQYLAARDRTPGAIPEGRDLEPERDRLVILTSPSSSGPVKNDLADLLGRIRTLKPHRSEAALGTAASTEAERHALNVVREHVRRSWAAQTSIAPTEDEIGSLLELVWVLVLDVDPEGTGEREARTILRQSILKNPEQADAVWKSWIENQALLARAKAGLSRAGLQALLVQDAIGIRTVRSYREDIDRLQAHTLDTLKHQARYASISLGGASIKITRPCVAALVAAAAAGPVVVVGDPGAGKSGAQYDAVRELVIRSHDVVVLAAEGIAALSLGQLRDELGLEHELIDVLANWPGTSPGYLVIDALDAARSEEVSSTLRALIERVTRSGNRWRVVASIRKFDLRHSPALRQLFVGNPVSEFSDAEFARVRHLNVPLLDPSELAQATGQSNELRTVVGLAAESLRELLRVPFNLSLIAALLEEGVTAADLTPIRTQLELLDRYWEARVRREDRRGDVREAVLRTASEEMVRRRAMRVPRNVLNRAPVAGEALHEILSANVLSEWRAPGTVQPDQALIAFSHHLLFDYGVARLLFRGESADLLHRLEEENDLTIAFRPSIVLHFHHLWAKDTTRRAFWSFVELLQRSDRLPEVAKTIGPVVASDLFATPEDISPLVDGLGGNDGG